MKSLPRHQTLLSAILGLFVLIVPAWADDHVAVVAFAREEYTQRKYENGKPKMETYVFMQGKFFEGHTADRSIAKMSFRRIAEYLAPELAKQQYLPTRDPAFADLLLIVHWGTTVPRITGNEMRAVTTTSLDTSQQKELASTINETQAIGPNGPSPGIQMWLNVGTEADRNVGYDQLYQLTDQLDGELHSENNAQLLGYTKELSRLSKAITSTETEATLRSDLAGERYFIIIKAYSLREPNDPGRATRRPVWTMFLNISSPGNNFGTALDRMSVAAVDFFGRTTDGVKTTRAGPRTGTVTIAPIQILGEVK